MGHLTIISRDLGLEVFQISNSHAEQIYHTHVRLNDDPLLLRDPCPSCSLSYNQYPFNNHQTIIPVSERLYVITFLNHIPYFQILWTPGCEPISIFKPSYFDDVLYMQCRDPTDHGRILLSWLIQDGNNNNFLEWTFQPLPNFDSFSNEGTFYEYYDRNFEEYMVYFTYTLDDLLYFEGPDNNYFRFFALPSECTEVIRISAVRNSRYNVVLECSVEQSSGIITAVHSFDPDQGSFVKLLDTSYTKCPIQFYSSNSESILAIFSGGQILVQDLYDLEASAQVNVSGHIYDGLLTKIEEQVYAVYATGNGLHILNVSQALSNNGESVIQRLDHSENICAHIGCPLLTLLDERTIVASLDPEIALYSLIPPRLLSTANNTNLPARFIFGEYIPKGAKSSKTVEMMSSMTRTIRTNLVQTNSLDTNSMETPTHTVTKFLSTTGVIRKSRSVHNSQSMFIPTSPEVDENDPEFESNSDHKNSKVVMIFGVVILGVVGTCIPTISLIILIVRKYRQHIQRFAFRYR